MLRRGGMSVMSGVRAQRAEQAVRFVVRAGVEIERLARPSIAVVAEQEGPQPINNDRLSGGIVNRFGGAAI